MKILEIAEAKDVLRISGNDNDEIINSLLDAIPSYLEASTGYDWIKDNPIHPLVKTITGFILQLWYYPQDQNSDKTKKVIDALFTTLTVLGRGRNG